jgi:hypothetical protein
VDNAISQDKKDVVHRLLDVGSHIVKDYLEDGREVGGATQGGALEGVPVSVVEAREPLYRGVEGAGEVETVGD